MFGCPQSVPARHISMPELGFGSATIQGTGRAAFGGEFNFAAVVGACPSASDGERWALPLLQA